MPPSSDPITVYFLQASRSIRVVWLLEELGVAYNVEFSNREQQKAPQSFKDAAGNPMGKFPTIRDGNLTLYESGAITEYLCDKYDTAHRLLPASDDDEEHGRRRAAVNIWIHAAESTFMLFGLAVLYARWNLPADIQERHPDVLERMEASLSKNVIKAFEWLESTLKASKSGWLVGDALSAADIMVQFSAEFVLERKLGTEKGRWPRTEAWLDKCRATDSYRRAVQKSGYTLYPTTS